MLNLKKTALAVLALGSSAVFAGTMGPVCTPGNVTVPCPTTGWDVGGQALIFQLMNNIDFNYVNANLAGGYASVNVDTSGEWNWGFQLEASYHFNTGNDLTVNWYHIDTGWNTHWASPSSLVNLGASAVAGYEEKSRWDAINGEFGQYVDFSANKKIRFHGGFQVVSIKDSLNAGVLNANLSAIDTAASNVSANFSGNTQYNGFGPRTGTDLNYVFGNGFGIYAKGAAAVFVGTTKHAFDANTTYNPFSVLLPALPTSVRFNSSQTRIVPELEARLGANYTYAMAQGDLSVDAGYMWFDYIHALDAPSSQDFGAAGPYFGLKYVGNI